MEFDITIAGESAKTKLDKVGANSNSFDCKIGEKHRKIVIRSRDEEKLVVSIDDKMYFVSQISRTESAVEFIANGEQVAAAITGRSSKISETYSGIASIGEFVVSNFPAKVVKVNVSIGSSLRAEDPIVVLEAMKMEAMIKTPKDCFVEEIYVKEGDIVERGMKLAKLHFSEPAE
jgi:biotin carboxyl carrier protein